jgi:hypothetical protein
MWQSRCQGSCRDACVRGCECVCSHPSVIRLCLWGCMCVQSSIGNVVARPTPCFAREIITLVCFPPWYSEGRKLVGIRRKRFPCPCAQVCMLVWRYIGRYAGGVPVWISILCVCVCRTKLKYGIVSKSGRTESSEAYESQCAKRHRK